MRLQFRLRTLFVVVTIFAVVCAYVGWQAKIVRERNMIRQRLATERGEVYEPTPVASTRDRVLRRSWGDEIPITMLVPSANPHARISWIRRLLGDRPVTAIGLFLRSHEECERVAAAFPEAAVFNLRRDMPDECIGPTDTGN